MRTVLFITILLHTAACVTVQQEAKVKAVCHELLSTNNEFIGGFVRLSFHDCVGGCDGCINLAHPDNRGLGRYINVLEAAYDSKKISEIMSRADFWALCGTTAVSVGHTMSNQPAPSPQITVRYGRKDCNAEDASTTDYHDFPNAHGDLNATLTFFRQEFGMNDDQAVALLGAHTLGRARRFDSGFDGSWVGNPNSLANGYFRDMLDQNNQLQWKQVNRGTASDPRWQWVHKGGQALMLNADMCLLRDIQPDNKGQVTANLTTFALSKTSAVVQRYARNNALWLTDFAKVFTLMIENKQTNLTLPSNGDLGANIGLQDTVSHAPAEHHESLSPPTKPVIGQRLSPPPRPSGLPPRPSGLPPRPSGLPPRPSGLPPRPSGLPPRPSGLPPRPSMGPARGPLGRPLPVGK